MTKPRGRRRDGETGSPGLPVDYEGAPAIDPTENVIGLVKAAERRQDDLRLAGEKHALEMRRMKEKCEHELDALRDKLSEKETQRLDATGAAERSRIDAQFLNIASALVLASEKQGAAAAALATQLIASAEVLRASAAAQDSRTQASIRTLEQQQFQGAGRDAGTASQRTESRAGNQWIVYLILGAVTVLSFLFGVASFVVNSVMKSGP